MKEAIKCALSFLWLIATTLLFVGLGFCFTLLSIVYPFAVPSSIFVIVCIIYCSKQARLALLWYLLVSPSLDAATLAVRSKMETLPAQSGIVPAILRAYTNFQK